MEYREQPIDAVIREFREETGMEIKAERLLTLVSAREDHHLSAIYLCRIVNGEFRESNEISEMKYFPVNELPAMMLAAEKELIQWAVKEIK